MKKTLMGLLLAMNAIGYADTNPCNTFKITVKNDTPMTCYLAQRIVKSGTILKHEPYKLSPGLTSSQFELSGAYGKPTSISLTYECGDNQTITLFSEKSTCSAYSSGTITGTIVNATNMNATFILTPSSYFMKKAGTIYWVIS